MGKYYLGTGNQQINFQVVDSTGVINDLNLSGLYLSITGKAADADKLDNLDSSFFRNAANLTGTYTGSFSGKAADSDLLDGYDSSYFLDGANITGTVELSGTFTGYYTGVFSGTIGHTDYIQFHTGLGINPDPAELTWNDAIGTMQLGLGANIDLRVGFQNYEFVANRNGSTLLKGSAVYISGAQGNRPAVGLALANADSTSSITFAILAEDIAPLNDGYAITNGLLTNLNTTGFAAGATLYLSPTVSGGITSTKPQAPEHNVLLGFCVRSHQSAGEILVKIQNGLELDELHDVRLINKQNNDIVRYNAPSGVWYNSNTLAIDGTGLHHISGDLGIGTSAPTAKLHIVGADKRQIIASTTDNAALVLGQWDGATNRIESSTRKLLITSYASGISLGINGSEHVHVSTSGNLGVGTTSPSAKLQVNGSAIVTGSLTVDTSTLFVDATNDRVGIGTAVPEARLDIYHPSNLGNFPDFGKNGARFRRPGVFTEFGYIEYPSGGDKTVLGSFYSGGGYGQISLRQHSSVTSQDSFTLDNSGNANIAGQLSVNVSLAVGTFSPTAKLEVESGGSDTVGMRVMDGVNGVWTEIRRRSIECVGGDFWINGQTSSLDLRTGNVSRLFISSTGVVTFSGAVIASSITAPASTNLTLAGGSSGASLVLGQGTAASATITPTGAGNISLSGPVQVNGATNNASYKFTVKRATNFQLGVGLQNASSALSLEAFNDTITANVPFAIYGSPLSLMGGNVLLGTFTDGGQKLQVNGDIISSSTSGSNIIANDPTFSEPVIQLREAGVNKAVFKTLIGDAYLSTQTAGKSIYFRSGNATTALTLDASQDATFAGRVSVGNGASKGLTVNSGSGQNLFTMQQAGVEKWVQYLSSGSLVWFNSTLASNALTLNGATSAATFVGSVSVNNTAASTGAGSGALQIAGGIYSGATSVFAGNVTVTNNTTPLFLAVDTRTSAGGGIAALSLNTSDQFWQVQNSGGNLLFRDNTGPITALTITKGTGEAAFASTVTATGSASTSVALRLDNATGGGGSAQYYTNFTSGAVVISRLLRGNGLSGYATNGLNIDNFDGFQVGLNILGGSGGAFTVRTGGTTDLFTIASTGASTFAGAVTITGNLTVNGTTTTVNSTTVTVDDPIITLGGDTAPTIDDNKDRGVEFKWHNGTIAKIGFFGFDDSTGYLTFIPDATNTSEVFSGTQGDIQASNFRGNLIGNVTGNVSGSAGSVATLTAGAYLTGGSFNGSAAVTFAVDATSANTVNKVIARDGSGNFSAGAITASSLTAPTTTDLTLAGGSTGASLVLGQGASGGTTITNAGSSVLSVARSSDGNVGILIRATGGGNGNVASGAAGGLYLDGGTVRFRNQSGATEWGQFTTTGNLLIGTATDGGQKLQVAGTAAFADAITVTTSAGLAASFTNATDNNWSAKIIKSGGNELQLSGNITANSGPSIRAVTSGGAAYAPLTVDGSTFTAKISSVAALTIASNQAATFAGAVSAGGATAGVITPQLTSQAYYQAGLLLTNTKTDNAGVRNWALVTAQDSYGDFQIKQSTTLGGSAAAGTAWMKISETGAATFAGNVTVSGVGNNTLGGNILIGSGDWPSTNFGRSADRVTISSNAGGAIIAVGDMQSGVAANRGGTMYLFARGTTATNDIAGGSIVSKRLNATSGNFASSLEFGVSTASISNPQTRLTITDTTATFAGAVTVNGTDKFILLNGATTQFSRALDVRTAGDTEGRLLLRGGGSLLFGDGAGTFDSTLARTSASMLTVTGGLTISSTTPSTGAGSGALQVAGGAYFGQASVFASSLTVKNTSPELLFTDSPSFSTSRNWKIAASWAAEGDFGFYRSTANDAVATTAVLTFDRDGLATFAGTVTATNLDVSGNSVQNVGLVRFTNNYSSGSVYYPTARFIQTRGNHSYGVVSEFITNTAADGDRPSILFYGAQGAHSWQVGQITSGWGAVDDFGIGYRTSNTPSSFSSWPTNYFTIKTSGNVGIGTTSPIRKLDVVGGIGVNAGVGNSYVTLDYTGVQSWHTRITADNTSSYIIGNDLGGAFNTKVLTLTNAGNVGIGTTNPGYKLEVNGSFAATTKSFVILHPTKEGKKLRYGSLEGPENGVYVRGKTTSKVIELPDYWTKLVDPESISVQLTPIGSHQKLYVEKIENNKVYIANENLLAKNINCFFYILAERADVEKLQVEIDA